MSEIEKRLHQARETIRMLAAALEPDAPLAVRYRAHEALVIWNEGETK